MKLLLDQNLSRRLVPPLEASYPGSTQVALAGLESATDLDIWQFAKTHGFVIVTKDADFEEISILKGTPPKVIWIRTGNAQNQAILNILLRNKIQIDNVLSQEEIGCLELYE
ncbi:MAG: DUF5615 family PIN-like protein [Nitrosomonas sp.]|nr:DUF5615 family PIN-like protein [Nitrosomonas sp.]